MATERVQVEFTPETRRLVIRLIEAVEKLGGGRGEEESSELARRLARRLSPVAVQLDALLEESGRDGVAHRLISDALAVEIPRGVVS